MSEQERLDLVSTVEDEFSDPLERLETALEDVDDEIRQTGSGRDHVGIHVEVTGVETAISELESLNAAIGSIDDDITLDVDTNFEGVLRDDVQVNSSGRGSQFIDDSGQFTSSNNALDRRFSEIGDALGEELSATGDVEIDTEHVDVDAANADTPSTPDSPGSSGVDRGRGEATGGGTSTSLFTAENMDKWRGVLGDAFDEEEFARRGGEVTNPRNLIEGDLEDHFDLEGITQSALNDDSDSLDTDTVSGFSGGPSGFTEMIGELSEFGLTSLGEGDMTDGVLDSLKQNASKLQFTMGSFHKILGALIPLMAVFVGAIPAAIVGMGALATAAIGAAVALGGIAGLGAMGIMLSETGKLSMKPLKERLNSLVQSFTDAFAPLAQSLAPIIETTVSQIEAMMGPLATASTGLLQFRQAFTGAIGYITSSLPSFVSDLLSFSNAAMPILKGIFRFFANSDFLGYLATQLRESLPQLIALGQAAVRILPAVISLSQGFLIVATALTSVIGVISTLINRFPLVAKGIGFLIASLLVAVTVVTLYTIVSLSAAVANLALASSIRAVIASTIIGILVVAALSAKFANLTSNVRDARKELKKFASAKNALNSGSSFGSGTPTGGGGPNVYSDNSTTVIYADNPDDAARQTYSSQHEHKQHVDSVFGG